MKDFAKSIRVGNANKDEIIKKKKEEGAILKVDNGQKLEFSDGTTYVKTSFSDDYREAKNYTGNAKACNEDWRDIIESAKRMLADAKRFGWAETGYNGWTKEGLKDFEKRIKDLEERQKRENKTGNRKVGNGLKDDLKRAHPSDSLIDEIKSSATYEAIKKEPWRVYDILGVGDSTLREFVFDLVAQKYGMKYDDLYHAWMDRSWGKTGNKVGNARSKEQLLADVRELTKYIKDNPDKSCEKEKRLLWEAKEELDKNYGVIVENEPIDKQEWSLFKGLAKDAEKEVGNKKVGNYFNEGVHLTIMYNGKEQEVKVLKDMPTKVLVKGQSGNVIEINKVDLEVVKVGNGTPGTIAAIGPHWSHGGTVYGKMDTDESGKHHNEYVKITWLGEGKGGVANYFVDDKIQSDKFGSINKDELKRWAEQKIGNKKVKNGDWRQSDGVLKYFDYSSDPIEPVVGIVKKQINKLTGEYEYRAAKTRGVHGPIDGKMFKTEDEAKRYVQNSWKSVYSPHWVDLSSQQYYAAYTAAKHDLEEAISYLKKNVEKSEKQYKYIEEARLKKAQDDLARLEEYVKTGNKLTRARHAMNASFYTTKEANPRGEYKETEIDVQKRNADFRLIDVSGNKNTIVWKSGKRETVSDNELEQLKRQHPNWMTDF